MKKSNCPICGSETELTEWSIKGSSTGSSSFISGKQKNLKYSCNANFDVCSASVSIYNSFLEKEDKFERMIKTANDWRDALKRYNDYCDFIADQPTLKGRLFAIADEKLNIKGGWSHLLA